MEATVTIRTKAIKDNKDRLYLDFYPAVINPETGATTRREFLPLFLYSEIERMELKESKGKGQPIVKYITAVEGGEPKKIKLSPEQKKHNKDVFTQAEIIRGERLRNIGNDEYNFIKKDKNNDFLPYILELAEKQKTASNRASYKIIHWHLSNFSGGILPIKKLTPEFCEGFKDYLTDTIFQRRKKAKKLSSGTAMVYFVLFKSIIKKASVKSKILSDNPARDIEGVKHNGGKKREFLTMDELKELIKTDCRIPVIKRAAIFSALTGVRHCDLRALKWESVVKDGSNYSLRFTIQKTKKENTLPISPDAVSFLGEPKSKNTVVFDGLVYSTMQKTYFKQWVKSAGIKKHITFHCMRHTYATLNITLGNDIYTISKLLGHSKVSTTEIYANIINEKKLEAVNRITLS